MFKVDKEKCIGCQACVDACPVGAISMENNKAVIDGAKCIDCGRCAQVCPQGAIFPGSSSLSSGQRQFPNSGFGTGGGFDRPGGGRGLGRGTGKGLGRGPRDGRGGGCGGGGRRR